MDKVTETISTLVSLVPTELPVEKLFEINNRIDETKARELIDTALAEPDDPDETSVSKGRRVEAAVQYLVENCGFLENCQHNLKNRQHEIDHWGEFSFPVYRAILQPRKINGAKFIGESKNFSKRLNVDRVYKLEGLKLLLDVELGAYFTKQGLTGDAVTAAKGVLSDFYVKFGRVSVVFTQEDWKFLRQQPRMFNRLFLKKFSKFLAIQDSKIDDFSAL